MPINPIFEEKLVLTKSSTLSSPVTKRKTRSDKRHDIKFPVTPAQKEMLRLLSKKNRIRETSMTTKLLSISLREITVLPDYEYHDTKKYMHVKPNQLEYERIVEFAIRYGISERKVVTLLMMSVLKRNEAVR